MGLIPSYHLSKSLMHATHSSLKLIGAVPNVDGCRASQGIDGTSAHGTCVLHISQDTDPWYQVDLGDFHWVLAVT